MRAVGIHMVQDARAGDAPGRSAVAEVTPDSVLSGVLMCRSEAEIADAVGPGPALVLVDAPLVVPEVRGRRDVEHVLAWLDIPAFPVTPERMRTVHGGTRGPALARALSQADTSLRDVLKNSGCLTRDARMKERKKPGQPGARKRFQFSKR